MSGQQRNKGLRKVVWGGLAVAALAVAIWFTQRPVPVPVDLAEVTRGPLEVTINAEGQTRIRDIYDLSAPVTGQLARSPVAVGDTVVAGETIVGRIAPGAPGFLDDRARAQAEAAVAQAEAALSLAQSQIAMAEADLGHAQVNLSRLVDLHARGTVPQAQLDEAELGVDLAAAKLDAAHASYDMRQGELTAQRATLIEPVTRGAEVENPACCVDLIAPVSGTVLNVAHESARMVQAGASILSIGETNDLEIVADLLSSDAVRLSPGAPAYVERWGGAGDLAAHLRVVEPVGFTKLSALGIEEQRVKVLLEFDSPKEARSALGHGFRTYLRIVEWRGEDVLRVPVSALFRDGGRWAVYVVTADHAGLRHVEIDHRNERFAEVTDGLAPGDRVITHPGDRIADGVLIVDRASLAAEVAN
ncbi:efflux RND transporter periplasmic adaptor subunit [Aliiroseovarius crassostreae]|uniref:efflux RND transporter periplasmic adaptor subunit n=1 Tax=Aliiroseovarius crassostreae TaxID=154981 RepID=UPI003C79A08C